MPEQHFIREAVVTEPTDLGVMKYCAYNSSRECFVSASVEAGDFAAGLDARLRTLTPGSTLALWIVPFRGISPTSVRVPVDLLYLNENQTVLETVESYPISTPNFVGIAAASVLVLPANTIASSKTRAGDRLLLCAAGEMKWKLGNLLNPEQSREQPPRGNAAQPEPTGRARAGQVLEWVHRSKPKTAGEAQQSAVHAVAAQPAAPAPQPAPQLPAAQEAVVPAKEKRGTLRGWLQSLLPPANSEPRKAPRQAVPGLSAYFFTGTGRTPHAIRDISATGLYVYTEERWYPGTIVRITLTHRGLASEQSIAVHGCVVRWGNDGVGMEFVFPDVKNPRVGATISMDGLMGGATSRQMQAFLYQAVTRV